MKADPSRVLRVDFLFGWWRMRFPERFPVRNERFCAGRSESQDRERYFSAIRFLDADVARVLQNHDVTGHVAFGEPALALEEEEVRLCSEVEDGHDDLTRRLVNDAIEPRDDPMWFVHSVATGTLRTNERS